MKTNLLSLFLVFLTLGCSNSEDLEFVNDQNADLSFKNLIQQTQNNPITDIELLSQYEKVMIEVLKMSKSQGFRQYIFEQALEQKGGDYDVYIDDIVSKHKGNTNFDKSVSSLKQLSSQIKTKSDGLRPLVFYPKAETLQEKVKLKSFNAKNDLNEPIVVLRDVYEKDYSSPGFTLDANDELVFNRMVTEEDAWQNDVYVIGEEENVPYIVDPCLNQPQAIIECGGGGGGSPTPTTRTDGRAEYGGNVQVIDMNAIEHWTAGKFEFRMIIAGIQGTASTIIRDIKYPKRARRNFKDRKWYSYGIFLFNWNTSNLGQFNIEKWMEIDGKNENVTTTISFPAQNGNPGISVAVKSDKRDEDLGLSIVQFTDPLTTVYGISYMNFKRN
ncbi:MAG: hypothetical protein L3J20_05190 [Flavobacteriaceae bacterium]|nr:hypothetical protein [Flavobacteriaceae bacterium]